MQMENADTCAFTLWTAIFTLLGEHHAWCFRWNGTSAQPYKKKAHHCFLSCVCDADMVLQHEQALSSRHLQLHY